MAGLEIGGRTGSLVFWRDKSGEHPFFDIGDFLSNKSSVSLHSLDGQRFLTVPAFLADLMREAGQYPELERNKRILLSTLMIRRLLASPHPIRFLEYGCGDGGMSTLFARILVTFHEGSRLVCASNALDENTRKWLARMEGLERLPHVDYHAGDYGAMELPERGFDMVYLDEEKLQFPDSEPLLEDAGRLVSGNDGLLFLVMETDGALAGCIRSSFSGREEYEIGGGQFLALVRARELSENGRAAGDTHDIRNLAEKSMESAEILLGRDRASLQELSEMAVELNERVRGAVEAGEEDIKYRLILAREKVFRRIAGMTSPI